MFVDRETTFSCYIVQALLDLQNQAHGALENLWWTGCKNQIENWTSFDLVMVIESAYLLIKKPIFHVLLHELC